MKRKINFLETLDSFSVDDVEFHSFLEEELRKVFGVHGFETSLHFVDTYDY